MVSSAFEGKMTTSWNDDERAFVRAAANYLENPRFLVQVADLVGRPIEAAVARLPKSAQKLIRRAVQGSLDRGVRWAADAIDASEPQFESFGDASSRARRRGLGHRRAAAASGAVGGFTGLASLPIELPVSTLIMLRSIAATAHEMGADLADPGVRLECVAVLSLGSRSSRDDAAETGYWTARVTLASAIGEAARALAKTTAEDLTRVALDRSAPALLRFAAVIASRFEIVVTERVMAQAVPIVGALSGAAVNTAFAHHFHTVALYHFGLRQLERVHGAALVEGAYRAALPAAPEPRGAARGTRRSSA